jgi:hypothetical protein
MKAQAQYLTSILARICNEQISKKVKIIPSEVTAYV